MVRCLKKTAGQGGYRHVEQKMRGADDGTFHVHTYR